MTDWNENWKRFCNCPELKPSFERLWTKRVWIAATACVAWLAFTVYGINAWTSLLAGIGIAGAESAFFLWLPIAEEQKRVNAFEAELPFALLSVAIQLEFGNSFERCLERVSLEKHGLVSESLKEIVKDCGSGKSVPQAISLQAAKWKSRQVRRAFLLLKSAYEGNASKDPGFALKQLAKELLERQHSQAKTFSGKMVVFALLFVTISAIVPALFLSFLVIGSQFLEVSFSPLQVFLTVCIGFPLLDAALLYFIRAQTPVFLREMHA